MNLDTYSSMYIYTYIYISVYVCMRIHVHTCRVCMCDEMRQVLSPAEFRKGLAVILPSRSICRTTNISTCCSIITYVTCIVYHMYHIVMCMYRLDNRVAHINRVHTR